MDKKEFKRKVIQKFVKLKVFEFIGILYGTLGTYYIGQYFSKLWFISNTKNVMQKWAFGMILNFLIMFIALILYYWILKNWEWAEEKVKEEEIENIKLKKKG